MNTFTADFLANLTADLSVKVLEAAGRRLRETLGGTEEQQALRRCVEAGIVTLIAEATASEPEQITLLRDIFGDFFDEPLVASELSKLLRGRSPDRDDLADLFEQAGYDADTLPGLDFAAGIAAFEIALRRGRLHLPSSHVPGIPGRLSLDRPRIPRTGGQPGPRCWPGRRWSRAPIYRT